MAYCELHDGGAALKQKMLDKIKNASGGKEKDRRNYKRGILDALKRDGINVDEYLPGGELKLSSEQTDQLFNFLLKEYWMTYSEAIQKSQKINLVFLNIVKLDKEQGAVKWIYGGQREKDSAYIMLSEGASFIGIAFEINGKNHLMTRGTYSLSDSIGKDIFFNKKVDDKFFAKVLYKQDLYMVGGEDEYVLIPSVQSMSQKSRDVLAKKVADEMARICSGG